MAIGAEEDDKTVFVGHPSVESSVHVMEGGVSLPLAEVAETGAGLEDGFYLAFSHRLNISAISFGVLVSMPCSLHSSMMRSRRRDIWAVS
mgnify:CR=1 FL=1